ncbi:hypothetical protein SMACR_09379 [Sordaria macrospora]|uniref:WGS project CABT00000000 data, contig 2.36 n=2 Tax=Sordaria macrospora TaxID=5147 RepID=F7W6T1_SORMK|nr:uncharacterized protein SMAC_09379 [Sordaria macrospora k-hell]KAA8632975.1 hypothetical protein SMACR_09379 [Sordaria macrospora]KAH7629286.1 hypothetical protein B0T09DRAFT_322010 [Sordaria sp. MPI-SDFR-AT-0083]WPJ63894.1 hypothetical protein SMAC4_09379 [Sordaria macrospora]CCC13221.1 unnamed protein product [Sordaria macrospora k-hell]
MEHSEATSPMRQRVGISVVNFSAPQTKRMQEESLGFTTLKKMLRMCPDEKRTADTPAPARQAMEENSPRNIKATLDPALWNDSTRAVYEHLKSRAEDLEDASIDNKDGPSTSKKDSSKSENPSKNGIRNNIFETLLGRIHSTLKQLHGQEEQEKREQPCSEPSSSPLSSLSSSRLSSPCS